EKNLNYVFKQFDGITFKDQILDSLVESWDKIGVDSRLNYLRVIFGLDDLSLEAKSEFCNSIIEKFDQKDKYLIWRYGYIETVDISYAIYYILSYRSFEDF